MYFPFLYGRRSEFLALRAMLKDSRPLTNMVPVIEPVRRGVADLSTCISKYGEANQALAVIFNPNKFELESKDEVKAWRAEILSVINKHESILPTYRCISTTTFAQVRNFLRLFEGRNVALAYSNPSMVDADIATLVHKANVRFHIVLNGKMTESQQDLLPANKRVDIRDYFNKLERNSDYDGDEPFTDRHNTFSPSCTGFGDYAAIGSAFSSGGGQPAAVAIHAIYKHKTGNVWIEHFVSDETDRKIGSTESKFLQAATKLVKASKARPKEFGTNFALDQYVAHVKAHHFPGLGTNKVLQIEHHICLMLDLLSGRL